MNPIKKNFYLFPLLILLTFGCRSCDTVESTKIAQSEIYQEYSIEASKDAVNVMATFRVGGSTGTTVDLDSPSRIEYNGVELTENLRPLFTGTIYTFATDSFHGRHKFVYTNGEGKVFTNEIDFEPLDPILGPVTIKPSGKTIVLLSRPVRENESVDVSIASLEPTPRNSNSNTSPEGNKMPEGPLYSLDLHEDLNSTRTAIVIDGGKLKNFAPGKAALKITVRANNDLKQKTGKGGAISYQYTSPLLSVTVSK